MPSLGSFLFPSAFAMRAAIRTEVCVMVCVTCAIGCGHPATDKECQEIVERIATLELEKATGSNDAKTVGAQVDETKKALAPNTMKDCVGKRITERAMQCVRSAKSSQQIVDDCFK
ncbi:MAG TPA: hypothetical protein VHM25_19865 [Polyangiaceae bacterium]|jgi:hypothetical protein|nr:hypothetical protein [Polyangiaceae bacterium]